MTGTAKARTSKAGLSGSGRGKKKRGDPPKVRGNVPREPPCIPADERRRQMVLAAYGLLDTDGLEGLTIRKVLNRTRLSRRAFYERFSSKDDLVLAVFAHTIGLAAQWLGEQLEGVADPMERLKTIVERIVLGADALGTAGDDKRSAALVREHLRLAESRPADLHAALSPLIELIARQLSDGMRAGLVRQYPAQRLAALFYNVVATTMHTEILASETSEPDPAHRVRLAKEIWEFCRPAIAAHA